MIFTKKHGLVYFYLDKETINSIEIPLYIYILHLLLF